MKFIALCFALLLAASACPEKTRPHEATPHTTPETPAGQQPAQTAPSAPDDTAEPHEPDAVTQASPPYEPGPSVVATGKVDGARLRARTVKRIQRDRSPVTLLTGDTPLALGEQICEAVVPRVPAELPVLIKPNIGGFAWFKNSKKHAGDNGVRGRTTDPEFVRGVIRCLKARGHTAITIADGWSAEARYWNRLMKVSGYQALADEEGARLVALNDDGVFDATDDAPGKPLAITGMESTSVPTLLMPKILAEHLDRGLYISVPKLKTHRFSVVSVAIKGLQGTVMYSDRSPAYRQKWRSHRELSPYMKARKRGQPEDRAAYVKALEVFATRMVDVLEVEAPHVVLAEGAPAMSGDGFHNLFPSAERVAIGGTNPVFVDRVGAEFLGLWQNRDLARELGGHATSPLIEVAAQRFGLDLSRVKVIGNGAKLLDQPRPVHFIAMAPFTIQSSGAVESSGEPDAHAGKPAAHARALGSDAIQLDGKLDDPAWRAATPVSWDTNYAGKATGIATRARFVWSEGALYAAFELDSAGLNTDTSRPIDVEREGLYKEDCVELFLVPDPARLKHYYEIEIGPHGHWFDLDINKYARRNRSNAAWNSGAQIATARDAKARRAVIEVAITSPDIARLLKPGARLPMGLYRMEGKSPRNYLAWSPPRTAKPKFHVPEAFGTLIIDP